MSKIIKLDKNLANQIAAGEVVERPVSIIKELIENSIDAGSSNIKIEIISGGIEKIIVTDNGEGMDKKDLRLSIEKYSTSKIKSIKDLYNVRTFGFRGEALSSISSVSKFKIISKIEKSLIGYSIDIGNEGIGKIKEIESNRGTKIIIKDLFYNTPARLNYLKKPRTEYNYILDFLNNISLCYPNIGFEFISDFKTKFKYNKNEKIESRIYNIYGEEFLDNLINLDFSFSGFEIKGYITNPKINYPNKKRQTLFVNNRLINSPLIYRAIMNGYNRFIPPKTFPGFILKIEIDPTQIDVNVHPRKSEIRFASEQNIFKGVYNTIEGKLNKVSLVNNHVVGDFETSSQGQFYKNKEIETKDYYTGSGTKFKSYSPYKDVSQNPAQGNIKEAMDFSKGILSSFQDFKTNSELQESNQNNDLHYTFIGKIIGQLHNSYILVETATGLQILDQHALAERIIYEKLIKKDYKTKIQKLLFPESFNLLPKEISILENSKEIFKSMGFDFEIMSSKIVILNGIPDFIKKEDLKKIFLGILEDIGEEKFKKSKTLDEIKNKIFAYTACRSAIKFGNKLNLFEMNKLLEDAIIDYSMTCPHGRPVVFKVGLDELKGKYER